MPCNLSTRGLPSKTRRELYQGGDLLKHTVKFIDGGVKGYLLKHSVNFIDGGGGDTVPKNIAQ